MIIFVDFDYYLVAAHFWAAGAPRLKEERNVHGGDMLLHGDAPQHGQVMVLPHLAQTFRELGLILRCFICGADDC